MKLSAITISPWLSSTTFSVTSLSFGILALQLLDFTFIHCLLFLYSNLTIQFFVREFENKLKHKIYKILTIYNILSLKTWYRTLLAKQNKFSMFSPVFADVSKWNLIFLSFMNYYTLSSDTSLLSSWSFLLPTRNNITSGSLYAITSSYHVFRLLNVSNLVIS